MAKEKNKINGWIVIDKPFGISSFKVVSKLKHILNPEKIGHGGTLDPLATGILPIALGKATKVIPYIMDSKKEYQFEVTWGKQTSTDDAEGKVLFQSEKKPTLSDISKMIPAFIGDIKQVPPNFSAIKVEGKRAYALAREGGKVELKERSVQIYSLKVLTHTKEKTMFLVNCGKGTYVRSLARDFGHFLGTYAYVSSLRRTQCGPFVLGKEITLAEFEKKEYNHQILQVMPVETVLDDILAQAVTETQARKLLLGQSVRLEREFDQDIELVQVTLGGQLIGLAHIKDNILKLFRVLK